MTRPDRGTFHARMKSMMASIRQEIMTGSYKPGDFLPSETTLSEQYRLSKNSVRQVLDQLLEQGMIVKIPRVGTQVAVQMEQASVRFGVSPSLIRETGMEELLRLFHDRHPHIQVEIVELPQDDGGIESLLRLGMLDVFTVSDIDSMRLRETGAQQLLEKTACKEDVYPFVRTMFETDEAGMLLAQPFVYSPVIVCYNAAHLREKRLYGPANGWTWDDLSGLLRQLKAPSRFGMFFQLSSIRRWPVFMLQNGVRFERDSSGKLLPERPGALSGLRKLRELVHEEGMFPLAMAMGDYSPEKLFMQQKVSVILTTYYRLNELKDAEFEYDIAQLPRLEGGETLLLATGLAVSAHSKQKEAALCLADFLASDAAQTHIRKHTFSLPASKWVTEYEKVELPRKPSRLELHREMTPYVASCDRINLSGEQLFRLGECLQLYFAGLADEEELLRLFNEALPDEEGGQGADGRLLHR
ncbi:extracellular solute-binding protein [Paenibacillus sp. MBLB4367]|uniref:extracellular solute-binding protein n=1 Tax=Paenibacillus sp. MBLB4367 TaxID=3384767 RepID=UPI0039080BA2